MPINYGDFQQQIFVITLCKVQYNEKLDILDLESMSLNLQIETPYENAFPCAMCISQFNSKNMQFLLQMIVLLRE